MSFCIKHSNCEHQSIKCQCNKCWTHEHQCEYVYDTENSTDIRESKKHTVDLATRRRQRKVANNNESTGNENLHCSETLCDSIEINIEKRTNDNERANRRNSRYSGEGTQLSIRSGTTEPISFHFPTPGSDEWAYYIHKLDEYQQSEDKKRFIEQYIGHFKQLYHNSYLDNIGQHRQHIDELSNQYDGRHNSRVHNSTGTIGRIQNIQNRTMEGERVHNNESLVQKQRHSSTTDKKTKQTRTEQIIDNKSHHSSSNKEKKRKRNNSGNDNTTDNIKQRRRSDSTSSGTSKITGETNYR